MPKTFASHRRRRPFFSGKPCQLRSPRRKSATLIPVWSMRVTGLRLVTLMLQRRLTQQEIEHFLATFSGSHRHILEFFVTEVLNAQTEPLVFLLQTSVLSRLSGSLCDAVTGRNNSEQFLKAVEDANLFLQSLDGSGQWYRSHPLSADAIQHPAR